MATKLGRCEYPAGCGPADFKCHGPVATEDTKFQGNMMADMGCFQQEGVDSNKYYHACVVTDKSGAYYVYVEYGRVGASKPQFQFFKCSGKDDAMAAFADQCAEKNTKRGSFQTIGGLQLFRPKPGKDLYVVQNLASRSFGLPDAKNISAAAASAVPVTKVVTGGTLVKKPAYRCDQHTTKLWRDLLGGAVTYARSTIQGGTIPVQKALDDGRKLLEAAKRRVVAVGDNVTAQISDYDLKQITYALYSSIPKIKPLNAAESSWILSKDNILGWEQDIGAFETALQAGDIQEVDGKGDDPLANIPVDMEWIDPNTEIGKYLYNWWPKASLNKHHYGPMKIHNMWKINRHGDEKRFNDQLQLTLKEMPVKWNEERPLHQDKKRVDIDNDTRKKYWDANVGLLHHGSRTINVPGIITQHFRVPKDLSGVVITGAMFGDFGTYLADDWRKSAGYTSLTNSYWSAGSGGVKGRHAFMFACDAVLGVPHVAPHSYGFKNPPKGTHCVFGKAGKSGVINNEWVAHPTKIVQRYLAEFSC